MPQYPSEAWKNPAVISNFCTIVIRNITITRNIFTCTLYLNTNVHVLNCGTERMEKHIQI